MSFSLHLPFVFHVIFFLFIFFFVVTVHLALSFAKNGRKWRVLTSVEKMTTRFLQQTDMIKVVPYCLN